MLVLVSCPKLHSVCSGQGSHDFNCTPLCVLCWRKLRPCKRSRVLRWEQEAGMRAFGSNWDACVIMAPRICVSCMARAAEEP